MKSRLIVAIAILFFLIPVSISAAAVDATQMAQDPEVASAIRLLEEWVHAQVAFKDIPSISMGIVYDQDLVWSRSFGEANRDRGLLATTDTQYSICSISKLFTSVAVMKLREEGKIDLDEPIQTYLPWFKIQSTDKKAGPVTLRAILTHSAGLPRESDYPYWSGPDFRFPTHEEIVRRVSSQEMLYEPQTTYQYSNLGLTLAGEIVAAMSSQNYSSYIESNILEPLNMSRTRPELPRDNHGKGFAVGYGPKRRPGEPRDEMPYYPVNGIAPAAGFASTINDLAKFASWQIRLANHGPDEILSSRTLREMQRVHWMDRDWDSASRGLGFGVWQYKDKTFVGHGGACPGYLSQFMIRPKDKLGFIVMTNGLGTNTGQYNRVAYDLVGTLLAKIAETEKRPAIEADETLKKYEGRYRTIWGDSIIIAKPKELVIISPNSSNPANGQTHLKPIGNDRFVVVRKGEERHVYRFDMGSDGRPIRVWDHANAAVRIEDW